MCAFVDIVEAITAEHARLIEQARSAPPPPPPPVPVVEPSEGDA